MDSGDRGQTGQIVAPPVEQVFNTALEIATILNLHMAAIVVLAVGWIIRHALLAVVQEVSCILTACILTKTCNKMKNKACSGENTYFAYTTGPLSTKIVTE